MRYIDSIVTAPEERILHRARLHWMIFFRPSSFLTLFLLPLVRWLTCEAVVTSRCIVIVRAPAHADHRFRSKPITDSGRSRSPIPEQADR